MTPSASVKQAQCFTIHSNGGACLWLLEHEHPRSDRVSHYYIVLMRSAIGRTRMLVIPIQVSYKKAHLHGRYGVPFFSLLDHVGPHATLPGPCRWVVCPRNRGFYGCHLSRRSEARVGEAYRSAPAWTAWPLAAREHASDVLVSMWSPMEHIGALMHAVVARIATIPNSPRSMGLSSR